MNMFLSKDPLTRTMMSVAVNIHGCVSQAVLPSPAWSRVVAGSSVCLNSSTALTAAGSACVPFAPYAINYKESNDLLFLKMHFFL